MLALCSHNLTTVEGVYAPTKWVMKADKMSTATSALSALKMDLKLQKVWNASRPDPYISFMESAQACGNMLRSLCVRNTPTNIFICLILPSTPSLIMCLVVYTWWTLISVYSDSSYLSLCMYDCRHTRWLVSNLFDISVTLYYGLHTYSLNCIPTSPINLRPGFDPVYWFSRVTSW